ncbi:putative copper transporter crmD [Aspergillus alliaceus]|uniref:putative copper transporter crmD n=1 Tax=Petromyces alliaceus TaxID=209559 RepID=UPI0012A64144|nr:Ctr copper transporter [Aspergillus alliaceus]KAB8228782.1 Ctr copper transporter [Aspergillus alliaceus]
MNMQNGTAEHTHGHSNHDMSMSAIFTTGTKVTLFFGGWTTNSVTSYLLTLAFLFLLAWFNRFLGALKFQVELKINSVRNPGLPVPIIGQPPALYRSRMISKDRVSPLPRYMQVNPNDSFDRPSPPPPSPPPLLDDERRELVPGSVKQSRVQKCFGTIFRKWVPRGPWSWQQDGGRSLLEGLRALLGYILMLAVMTFNVGIFCAVLAGIVVGELTMGRYTQQAAGWQDGSCHDG